MRTRTIHFAHEPRLPLPTSPRGHAAAMHFALRFDESPLRSRRAIAPPLPGEILFLSGASGSGKSSLLRLIVRRARRNSRVVNLRTLRLADAPVVDLFEGPLEHAYRRLSRVGLAEVWTWLRRPCELSEGQRWRLRLALALDAAEKSSRPTLLVCDEFAAVLDRVTAKIVAASVRRAVDSLAGHLAAVLATSHDDLDHALDPDAHIDCDFGRHELTMRSRGKQ